MQATSNAYLTYLSPSGPSAWLWSTGQEPCTSKNVRYVLSAQQVCHAPFAHNQTEPCISILGANTQIRIMIPQRREAACSMVVKAINKTGFHGSCFVTMDIGRNKRLATSQWSHLAEIRQKQVDLQPSRCCTGCSHPRENKKQQISSWQVFRSGRGQLRKSNSATLPAVSRSTNLTDSTGLKIVPYAFCWLCW